MICSRCGGTGQVIRYIHRFPKYIPRVARALGKKYVLDTEINILARKTYLIYHNRDPNTDISGHFWAKEIGQTSRTKWNKRARQLKEFVEGGGIG